jgi:hypothetical protein
MPYSIRRKDDPKTIGIAIYCPIPHYEKNVCSVLSGELNANTYITLILAGYFAARPVTVSASLRSMSSRYASPNAVKRLEKQTQSHAVCTVQTFQNPLSGPMLHLFSDYYLTLGYVVIIYDRHGLHRKFMKPFMGHIKFVYHPYTLFNILFAHLYSMREGIIQACNSDIADIMMD